VPVRVLTASLRVVALHDTGGGGGTTTGSAGAAGVTGAAGVSGVLVPVEPVSLESVELEDELDDDSLFEALSELELSVEAESAALLSFVVGATAGAAAGVQSTD
jgi:hypothetical protein